MNINAVFIESVLKTNNFGYGAEIVINDSIDKMIKILKQEDHFLLCLTVTEYEDLYLMVERARRHAEDDVENNKGNEKLIEDLKKLQTLEQKFDAYNN